MSKNIFLVVLGTLLLSATPVFAGEVDESAGWRDDRQSSLQYHGEGGEGMEDIRSFLLQFAKKEYTHMGANPFYAGGIPAAIRKNELAQYEAILKASLEGEGINTASLHKEFMRIADGQARRARIRDGEPFFSVNQKGGHFVKAAKLSDGSRGLLRNETGEDISGVLIVLMDGVATPDGRRLPVVVLLADKCGNAFMLPPRPASPSSRGGDVRPPERFGEREEHRRPPQEERREHRRPGFGERLLETVLGIGIQRLSNPQGQFGSQVVGRRAVCEGGRWWGVTQYSNGRTSRVPIPPPQQRR